MSNTYINRPWISSFQFQVAAYSGSKLEQVHKLSRNFVASLDLGCPGVQHVNVKKLEAGRLRYKAWVADWKVIYAQVSAQIRLLKAWRRTVRFPTVTEEQIKLFRSANGGTPTATEVTTQLQAISATHLERLQETAQVLLNARYNAKLAAAEARRRGIAARAAEHPVQLAA